jgi:hypothetical protein
MHSIVLVHCRAPFLLCALLQHLHLLLLHLHLPQAGFHISFTHLGSFQLILGVSDLTLLAVITVGVSGILDRIQTEAETFM